MIKVQLVSTSSFVGEEKGTSDQESDGTFPSLAGYVAMTAHEHVAISTSTVAESPHYNLIVHLLPTVSSHCLHFHFGLNESAEEPGLRPFS